MDKTLTPVPGMLLIQHTEPEQTTRSGIIVLNPESPEIGVVIRCGAEKEDPCPVHEGDRVIYKKWSGQELTLEGNTYHLISFDDVLAIQETHA